MNSCNLLLFCVVIFQISICSCYFLVKTGENSNGRRSITVATRDKYYDYYKQHCDVNVIETATCSVTGASRLYCTMTLISSVNSCDRCQVACEYFPRKCCFCFDLPKATPAPPPPSDGCFPPDAEIKLENGESVTMSDLQIGDRVQTVSASGTISFSKGSTFLERQSDMILNYKSIFTSKNRTLTLTRNHLVYARNNVYDKFNPIYADVVSTGDEVLVLENDKLVPTQVLNTSSPLKKGAFVPPTKDGNISVNGVLASCYPEADHDMAHLFMAPMQWFPEVMNWIFGNDDGIPIFVNINKELGLMMLPC